MTQPARYVHRMVDELYESGELASEWRDSFLSVPRHAFIPDMVWRRDVNIRDDNDLVPLPRADDPETWLELAYEPRKAGQVVTPWETPYGAGGLLSLKVSDDGTATGGIVDNVAFMCLRDQRPPRAQCH